MEENNNTSRVRLQKYIAECGVCSRRAAEKLIVEGRVKVNRRTVTELGTKIDPTRDEVRVQNKIIKAAEKGILLLHKPRGVVSTLSDPEGRKTVADYLSKHYESYFPVGRLDYESTGLVIMTNDGELAEHLMHPRYQLPRVYSVRVEGTPTDATVAKLQRGVTLADGPAKAEVKLVEGDGKTTWMEVVVTEGRNRLVRRLMERVGHPVVKLRRIAHGPVKLGKLKPGEIRKLTQREYQALRQRILKEK